MQGSAKRSGLDRDIFVSTIRITVVEIPCDGCMVELQTLCINEVGPNVSIKLGPNQVVKSRANRSPRDASHRTRVSRGEGMAECFFLTSSLTDNTVARAVTAPTPGCVSSRRAC